jgi:hypothetical protein
MDEGLALALRPRVLRDAAAPPQPRRARRVAPPAAAVEVTH